MLTQVANVDNTAAGHTGPESGTDCESLKYMAVSMPNNQTGWRSDSFFNKSGKG